jgi:AraC-like DNA-binding protein
VEHHRSFGEDGPTGAVPQMIQVVSEDVEGGAGVLVVRRNFGDPDEMAAAVRRADVEYVPLANPSPVDASLVRVELEAGALLQLGRMGFAHVTRARFHDGAWQIVTALDDVPRSWNGQAVDRSCAMVYRPGAEFQGTAPGQGGWAALSLPSSRLEQALASLAGAELRLFPESCRLARMDEPTRSRLSSLLERVVRVAAEDPAALSGAEARRALGESLLGFAVQAFEGLPQRPAERERTMLSHSRVVTMAEEFMRSRLALPLYVADLCLATGVSERTLRSAFHNVYGTGPNRFLKLRRLIQVRRALQHASPDTLVSEVATRHGFWDLGRFAGDYRSLFGESPSRTARRASA